MKRLLFFCLFITISLNTNAQSEADWTLIEQRSGVKVYVRYTICQQQSIVFLKAQNSTGKDVTFTWKERFTLKDRQVEVNSSAVKSFSLAASSTAEGICGKEENSALILDPNEYVSMVGIGFWELEIYDLTVQ